MASINHARANLELMLVGSSVDSRVLKVLAQKGE